MGIQQPLFPAWRIDLRQVFRGQALEAGDQRLGSAESLKGVIVGTAFDGPHKPVADRQEQKAKDSKDQH